MSADLYKYRVGKKWFTFDKNILEPEDLRVFNLANWSDKLKIITIYNDLKTVENDDVVILKTKTEKANKDKRAQEYREKKQRLNQKLTEANETNNEAEQQKILKQLQQLDIDYADVVSIQTAETVNIAKANQVILNDVNEFIKQTSETLNQLKTSLTEADFKQLNKNFNELIEAKNETQLNDTITAINNKLDELSTNSITPAVETGVNTIKNLIDGLKISLNNIDLNEQESALFDILNHKLSLKYMSKLTVVKNLNDLVENLNISKEDLNTIVEYKEGIKTAINANKKTAEWAGFLQHIGTYIRIYNLINSNHTNIGYTLEKDDSTSTKPKNFIKTTYAVDGKYLSTVDKETFMGYLSFNAGFTKVLTIKFNDLTDNDSRNKRYTVEQFNVNYTTTQNPTTYETVKTIVDNKKVAEVDKPGAVEGEGFLGLKTNRAAKQDYKNLMDIITNVKKQVEEMAVEITTLKGLINPAAAQKLKEVNQQQQQTFKEVNQQQQQTQPERSFLTDITEKPRLKHIEPAVRTPEITDLERLMNKRRQDIEPDSYSEDDDEEWADGIKVKNNDAAARPEGSRVGGILGELQRDLNKYGLVLSLSPDKNAYFINVFNRKNRGSGVEEATKLVNSVDENTEYKDLKKLYESLY